VLCLVPSLRLWNLTGGINPFYKLYDLFSKYPSGKCIVDGYYYCVVDRHCFLFLQDCVMYSM